MVSFQALVLLQNGCDKLLCYAVLPQLFDMLRGGR